MNLDFISDFWCCNIKTFKYGIFFGISESEKVINDTLVELNLLAF